MSDRYLPGMLAQLVAFGRDLDSLESWYDAQQLDDDLWIGPYPPPHYLVGTFALIKRVKSRLRRELEQ